LRDPLCRSCKSPTQWQMGGRDWDVPTNPDPAIRARSRHELAHLAPASAPVQGDRIVGQRASDHGDRVAPWLRVGVSIHIHVSLGNEHESPAIQTQSEPCCWWWRCPSDSRRDNRPKIPTL